MSNNQTQYSKEFLQQVEELKKEIEEVLRDECAEIKQELTGYLEKLNNPEIANLDELFDDIHYFLGFLYKKNDNIEKAIEHLENVRKEYDKNGYSYSECQYQLGLLYQGQGNNEKAKEHWKNVQPNSCGINYTEAQRYLGSLYWEENNLEKAKEYFEHIKGDPLAQYFFGFFYLDKENIEQAKKYFENIKKEHIPIYNYAQYYLGLFYKEKNNIEKAEEYWNKIQKEDDKEFYISAQFDIGLFFKEQGNIEKAKLYWNNITENDCAGHYGCTQYHLGWFYKKQNDIEQTKKYWHNIKSEYNIEPYTEIQLCLAEIYAIENNKKQFEQCCSNIKEHCQDIYIKEVVVDIKNAKIIIENKGKLLSILLNYLNIRDELKVITRDMSIDWHERAFAHYTEVTTAIHLLEKNNQWNFRISSAEQFNDPTEGKVLFQFLNNYSNQLKSQEIDIDKSLGFAVFVGCFTFNHDSLNQFRLYGKKQNREATGVSLVLKPSFFSNSHTGIMNVGKKETIGKYFLIDIKNNHNFCNTPENNQKFQEMENNKLPLYRCIYLDPESFMKNEKGEKMPYLKIAARDELTFYRENDKNIQHFESYQEYIDDIQKEVNKQFKEMIVKIEQLFENIEENETKKEILNILNLILLPFSYLVKHSAYHEEQECRILYCCPFNDHAIIEENFDGDYSSAKLYRKYRAINKDDIARIYLSEGAKGYANVFKRLGIKDVRMSSNPFRTAEKE